jgi:hypothetical protein
MYEKDISFADFLNEGLFEPDNNMSIDTYTNEELNESLQDFTVSSQAVLPTLPVLSRKRKFTSLEEEPRDRTEEQSEDDEYEICPKKKIKSKYKVDLFLSSETGCEVHFSNLSKCYRGYKQLKVRISGIIDKNVKELEYKIYLMKISDCEKLKIEFYTINKIHKKVRVVVKFLMENTFFGQMVIENLSLFSSEKNCFFYFINENSSVNENPVHLRNLTIKKFFANNFVPGDNFLVTPHLDIKHSSFKVEQGNCNYFSSNSFKAYFNSCEYATFDCTSSKGNYTNINIGDLKYMKFILCDNCYISVSNEGAKDRHVDVILVDSRNIENASIDLYLNEIKRLIILDSKIKIRCFNDGTIVKNVEYYLKNHEKEVLIIDDLFLPVDEEGEVVFPETVKFFVDQRIVKKLEIFDIIGMLENQIEVVSIVDGSIFTASRCKGTNYYFLDFTRPELYKSQIVNYTSIEMKYM